MIGVFDSGIGGLNILKELRRQMPNYNFLYYADSKNNPYGEKTDNELLFITSSIVKYLQINDCKLVVIACNTATTRCMKKLREKYKDLIFVGTVPAIKVACDKGFKKILVMATPATIESKRTEELIRDNKKLNQEIYLVSCYGLANAIETKDYYKIRKILKNIHEEYKNKNIDCIVLGCTHYPNIKRQILEFFPNVELLDGIDGVAKEVKRQLELNNIKSDSNIVEGTVTYVNSKCE